MYNWNYKETVICLEVISLTELTKPVRRPNRLKEYDYNQDGVYFITMCTQNREQILSNITIDEQIPQVHLMEYGRIVEKYIMSVQYRKMQITVNHYVIMPDHVHILLSIQNPEKTENMENGISPGNNDAISKRETDGTSRAPSPTNAVIPQIVSGIKRLTNREIGFNIWQRSYYDHVIRDEQDYWNIWQYIENNPARWCEKNLHTTSL